MKSLFELAADVQEFLESQRWRFCFIGGLALQAWGENRLTRDIDFTLMTGFGREAEFIDRLLARFRGRRADARQFALDYRVLLLKSDGDIGIDVSLGALSFEEALVDRAVEFQFLPGVRLKICCAEDLVVLKSFAARPQDWVDVRGVIVRQGSKLDRSAVLERLTPLVELKEEPEIMERVCELFEANNPKH